MPENPVGEGIGHFLGAIRVDAFRPADEFKTHMDNWIKTFRNAKAVETKQVQIPGDPEKYFETERMQKGIPLMNVVIDDLNNLAQELGISPLSSL
jgi:LDH2 family malate/lactate/ureidoglycolate dehydrogenase